MIRKALPEDGQEVLRRASGPALGPLCSMHWQMQCKNPRLPHHFFLVGSAGLLQLSGGRAFLCGRAEDAEELGAFLRFSCISQLTALDFMPPGWALAEEDEVLLRPPAALPAHFAPPPGLVETPPAEDLLAVLESADGPIRPLAARDYFYADLCARRNHGYAVLYGLHQGGRLVSTAGLWALTPQGGYLANVETRPEHQRQGHAGALIRLLCARYGDRPLSLLCRKELLAFYARFGFLPTGQKGLVSVLHSTGRTQDV